MAEGSGNKLRNIGFMTLEKKVCQCYNDQYEMSTR